MSIGASNIKHASTGKAGKLASAGWSLARGRTRERASNALLRLESSAVLFSHRLRSFSLMETK
jgi:hypothetical protein